MCQEIERQQIMLENFIRYCNELTEKGEWRYLDVNDEVSCAGDQSEYCVGDRGEDRWYCISRCQTTQQHITV